MPIPRSSRYDHLSIRQRADFSWPEGKRLAFCVTTNVEVFAFMTGYGADPGRADAPQTQRNYGWRDYGLRIGIWRLLALADELGLPLAHNMNSLVYAYAPDIAEAIRARGDEMIGHGRTNAEAGRALWEADEARMIADVTATFIEHEGRAPAGWMSPGGGQPSVLTTDLLKEAGYRYVLDWPIDDQPVWLRTRAGPILSVPYPIELNDIGVAINRRESAEVFADMIVDQFDEMIRQCAANALVMHVSVHPFIMGQPFRLNRLRRALMHCLQHARAVDVWWTRPGAVADYCYALLPGLLPGSAR
ncbi:MAG: polysaccharide deacetylase [Proteobacteria bacterium]|nr:polysaccharide deacetylase [Burkholderiales bacterium]